MKKVLTVLLILVIIIVGGVWYMLSGAGDFIRSQIEKQGSRYLETEVTVDAVDMAYSEGRLAISGTKIHNPQNFSEDTAFSLGTISLDLGGATSEPYVIQNVNVDAPDILYEMNAAGESNLLVLKDNIQSNLPSDSGKQPGTESDEPMPRVIVENVTVSNARLRLNFEAVDTTGIAIEQKAYEVTLPTFNAGAVGKPDGLPADQVGAAIMNAMLDNIIAQAKEEARSKLKEKAREKVEQEKDKLMNKAKDKLKGLFDKENG
ncbi:hypothetical protein [Salinimonas sediminis]|uniref:AsmA family protein n=1 Tax=Salinimonas sediminis TaxID=2303538 RepID=A0A346NMY3_9ALTE|nr:hypothetical protein [Salinimonas sediminis]AXR06890.1 hypothetical protein D0Y50_11305 [Salinimonas sediminis]